MWQKYPITRFKNCTYFAKCKNMQHVNQPLTTQKYIFDTKAYMCDIDFCS